LFQYLDSLEKIEGLLSLVKGYVSLDYFYLLKALFFVALLPAVLAAAYIIAVLFKLPSLHAYGTATGVVSILVSIVWYAAFTFIFRDSQWLSLISLAQQGTHPNLFSALSSLVDSGIILGTAPIFITTVVFIRLFVDENILSAKYFLNQAGLM
jgi:hypothetical protein